MAELEMSLELDFEIEDFEEENEQAEIDSSTLKLRNNYTVCINKNGTT